MIEEFATYICVERGLSRHTQKAYCSDVEQFHQFCMQHGHPWPPQSTQTISLFLAEPDFRKKKESSRARFFMALKSFFHFLYRENHTPEDFGSFLEAPKVWQTLPHSMGYQDMERLLATPDVTSCEGIRDRAILELLYGTGIRISELCSLRIYDVSDDSIRVHGKGGKERLVPLGKEALKWIDTYLSHARDKWKSQDQEALFLGPKGKPIDRIYIWKRIKELASRAGVQGSISPHTFRHTYASHLLDAGADVRIIQELLGHAHISSTDRYTHVSMSQLQEVFRAFHPRWNE